MPSATSWNRPSGSPPTSTTQRGSSVAGQLAAPTIRPSPYRQDVDPPACERRGDTFEEAPRSTGDDRRDKGYRTLVAHHAVSRREGDDRSG